MYWTDLQGAVHAVSDEKKWKITIENTEYIRQNADPKAEIELGAVQETE